MAAYAVFLTNNLQTSGFHGEIGRLDRILQFLQDFHIMNNTLCILYCLLDKLVVAGLLDTTLHTHISHTPRKIYRGRQS